MVSENEAALQAAMEDGFKTAGQEQVFETVAEIREAEYQKSELREWMRTVEARSTLSCPRQATGRWCTESPTAWR